MFRALKAHVYILFIIIVFHYLFAFFPVEYIFLCEYVGFFFCVCLSVNELID